jgi:hypothetical protein
MRPVPDDPTHEEPSVIKRALAILAALFIGLGAVVVGAAAPASAHVPIVIIHCDSVSYGFAGYTGSTNEFTLYVDGKVLKTERFDDMLPTQPRLFFDPTVAHEVRWTLDATEDIYDFTSSPVTTSPCVIDTKCDRVSVTWDSQLNPSLSIAMGVLGPNGERLVRAEVVNGIQGGSTFGGYDGLGVAITDWTLARTEIPLTDAQVQSGKLEFDYNKYAGDLQKFSVSVVILSGNSTLNLAGRFALACDLTTLPLPVTGAPGTGLWVTGALLILGGAGIYLSRRRWARAA